MAYSNFSNEIFEPDPLQPPLGPYLSTSKPSYETPTDIHVDDRDEYKGT